MGPLDAVIDGLRRVNRAPAVLACIFAVTLLAALPLSLAMRAALQSHLGHSMAAEQAARGVNTHWWSEFTAQAGPLEGTFTTTIIGFAAVLDNLSALVDGELRPAPVLWLGAVYLLLWLFLSGGIIDRYARARPTRAHEFFAACGVYFGRFLRLVPMMALAYYVLFAYVHPWLFDDVYDAVTRDVTVERTALFWRLGLYLAFGAPLLVTNAIFDYAKVRAVVEDRRSMMGAVLSAARFVRRNAGGVAALYLLNAGLFVALLLVYAIAAPGAELSGIWVWLGLAVSQLYLLARIWLRLVFHASEIALFQGRLAHAGYIASAPAHRPEPPIIEALAGTPVARD